MKHVTVGINQMHRTQEGLSLVELMIAMALGLIVLAGVLSLFLTNKQSYMLENAVAQIQEAGRFSLDFMRPQIRNAGYTGCGGQDMWSDTGMNLLNNTGDIYNFAQSVQGYDYNGTDTGDSYTIPAETPSADTQQSDWTPSLPNNVWNEIGSSSSVTGKIIPGSDVIMIHSVNPGGISVQPPSGSGGGSAGNIKVYDGTQISNLLGQIGYVTNCQESAVFQITNVQTSSSTIVHSKSGSYYPGNGSQGKADNMTAPTQLYTMSTYLYYIGIGSDGGPSLYVDNMNGSITSLVSNVGLAAPQELVPDVENMQILYGVDTDGDGVANLYESAKNVSTWTGTAIVSVRIALLTRSDSGVIPASVPGTYDLDDVTITPPPTTATPAVTTTRRMRKIFTETITLRNHVK